jgi:hypothetical protein
LLSVATTATGQSRQPQRQNCPYTSDDAWVWSQESQIKDYKTGDQDQKLETGQSGNISPIQAMASDVRVNPATNFRRSAETSCRRQDRPLLG